MEDARLAAVKAAYLSTLSLAERAIRVYGHRNRRCRDRDEFRAECLAYGWAAWLRLDARGMTPVAFGATFWAYIARQVRAGRRVCPRARGGDFMRQAELHEGEPGAPVRAALVDGRAVADTIVLTTCGSASPARQVEVRLDFRQWLTRLRPDRRRAAELLAYGERPPAVAVALHCTRAALARIRRELAASWNAL